MKRKKHLMTALVLTLAVGIPAFAVFNERNFAKTLSILRSELHQEYIKMENLQTRIITLNEAQHKELVDLTKRCNELALVLFSQNQDYTFDMSYALDEVTREYENYHRQRRPFDEIVERINLDIERYEYLAEALRRLPPILDKLDFVPDSLSAVMDTILVIADAMALMEGEVAQQFHTDPQAQEEEPFYLDEQGQADRDSCMFYTLRLLEMYTEARDRIIKDKYHYEVMSSRLEESYKYARSRYGIIQRNIFIDGQTNYFTILGTLPRYSGLAFQDAGRKYGIGKYSEDAEILRSSDWRGSVVSGFILFILLYIVLAALLGNMFVQLLRRRIAWFQTEDFRQRSMIFTLIVGVSFFGISILVASLFIDQNFFKASSGLLLVYSFLLVIMLSSLFARIPAANVRRILPLYMPVILLALVVITFRIIFIPNRLLNLLFPAVMLVFTLWQYAMCRRASRQKDTRGYALYSWITFGVMAATLVISWAGYVLLGLQIVIWWLFQLTAMEAITAFKVLLDRYEDNRLKQRKLDYRKEHVIYESGRKDTYIAVTWFFDLLRQVVIPSLAILSVPICLMMSSGMFDLSEIFRDMFFNPFVDISDKEGNVVLHLSVFKLIVVVLLIFMFKYLSYLAKGLYRRFRIDSFASKEGKTHIHSNELNFTLADNLISILVWGVYVVILILVFKIPLGALSIVAAGLATGLGLAMKDILNNFIYSIQLMSGRLRVGDYIECDGIRGKVTSISYQTTQIQTLEDTLIAFTNTTLFNKNFKNLTRGSDYEFVKVIVGVKYGSDIEKVREMLSEAVKLLQADDKYGRPMIDPKRGVTVVVDGLGESSVDIAIKQFVLVEERAGFIAREQELVYNTLTENGIEIPFPQRDVWIKNQD